MPRNGFDYAAIRDVHAIIGGQQRVADHVGCSIPTVRRALRERDTGNTATQSPGGPGIAGRGGVVLPPVHPAAVAATTIFTKMVRPVGKQSLFKAGEYSAKIGGVILKGKWRGLPVFTLTLEERATCPRTCLHWLSCYGNNSPYSIRFKAGEAFEQRVRAEVHDLAALHRDGFAIRLHNLGDFYSVAYVRLWADLLDRHPALRVFGFTARWDCKNDPIAKALVTLTMASWDRFAIRFSDAPVDECATVSIAHESDKPADAVICPQQMPSKTKPGRRQAESCSVCALCWTSKKRIAFIKH